ncbi:hypothetical protein FACS1894110_15710 [Spirochaetia bacterium]|nr:hypothetical protein FACS1894110_15710 [Spirochaetia bacterium]
MTNLQDEVYQAIARSGKEYGQIIEPNLKKELEKQIDTWSDEECGKFLNELMVNNAKRGLLRQWWEKNVGSDTDPALISITLKDIFGLK